MATRNGRLTRRVCNVVGLWCLVLLAAPARVRGEGSISFNGSSGGGTSKLQHTSANVPDGSGQMTICVWVYPDGSGEANKGAIVALDKDSSGIRIEHDDANKLAVRANWSTADGWWTFPVTDDAWNAVAVTYDNSATSKDPAARVNYATASVDEEDTPSGTAASANTGYCIGNLADQSRTWEGRIAHVQIFNRILSAAEMDACLRAPGSVKYGLKLWLPMRNATDVNDRSGNGFNGSGTDLTTGSDSPVYDSLYQFGVVSETLGQIVIPNSGHRGVRGLGPETTKLTADSNVNYRFITTLGFDTTPVDSVTIEGLTLDGNKISTDTYAYAGHDTSGEWTQADVADGIEVFAHHARITNCRIRGFRGNGVTIVRPADQKQWSIIEQIDNCDIVQNFIGVYVPSADQRIFQNVISNSRNAGIRIADDAGRVQTANNHVYGAYRAYENLGGVGCNHVNDYYADAHRGIHLGFGADDNNFTNCMVQHCWEDVAYIHGKRNSFSNCRFWCARSTNNHSNVTGVVLDHEADGTRFDGCQFHVNEYDFPYPETGHTAARAAIYINLDEGAAQTNCELDNLQISGQAFTISGRTGDVLMRVVGTTDGVRFLTANMDVYGFNDSDDKLLVVDDTNTYFRSCNLAFRGDFGGNIGTGGRTLGDLFDLPAAWGTTYNNSITVYDTYDGDIHQLNMANTY